MAALTVVLDANIYVSALVFGGKPKRAFQLGVSRLIDVAVSEPIRTEVLRILRDKNWPDRRAAVRRLADTVDAVEHRTDGYGTFYRVEGAIEGPTGTVSVVCIWLRQAVDGTFRFVTLMPARRRGGNVSATV